MTDEQSDDGRGIDLELTRKDFLKASGAGLASVGVGASGGAAEAGGRSATRRAATDGDVGNKVVFFDDHQIENKQLLSRVYHEAEKRDEPVIEPTEPWEQGLGSDCHEGNVYVYGTVIHDDEEGLFKMWYHTYDTNVGTYHTMYATSEDGLDWDKPNLGVYEYQGSTDNNIIKPNVGNQWALHSPSVVKDPDPDDPEKTYKMTTYAYGSGRSQVPWDSGYSAWYSSDGIEWTAYDDNPVVPGADVMNTFYDPVEDRFVATVKQYIDIEGALDEPVSRRSVLVSYSDDFEEWTDPVPALLADARDDHMVQADGGDHGQIYGMGTYPVEGTNVYVGFPWLFKVGGPNTIDAQMAFSRDGGLTWERQHRQEAIPRGAAGSIDHGMMFTTSTPIVVGDEVWVYTGPWDNHHNTGNRGAAVSLAKWRRDGFASLRNEGCAGTVTTTPVKVTGDRLYVNADLYHADEPNGTLRAEIRDAEGNVVPGFEMENSVPMREDAVDHRMRWTGDPDLGALVGECVHLRFEVSRGDIYAAHFTGTPDPGYCRGLNNELAAHYKLDEIQEDGTVLDATGNEAHGTNHGATVADGTVDDALEFDGSDDYVGIGDEPSLGVKAVTVAAWIDPGTLEEDEYIFDGRNHEYFLKEDLGEESLKLGVVTPGGLEVVNSPSFPGPGWTHVAGTYDGSELRIYVDGDLAATNASASGPISTSSGPARIGDYIGGGYNFTGKIDDLHVYNYALSHSEILTLVDRGGSST